ncbi:adenosine deaminase [Salinisphaera sp. PC39]|uniref:adenosine deaminase family protein n=1 Tax=Salinisphaera sp. PC39 TaxID=1304156 RepID=UPI003340510D
MFLQAMPKGADLHTHLSGAVYPERYVDWALADGLCIDPESAFLSAPPCDGSPALRRALEEGLVSRGELVDAWSLRAAAAMPDAGARHDHFFGVFGRIAAVSGRRYGRMLAEVVERNARQEVSHLELILGLGLDRAKVLARELELADAGPESEAALRRHGLDEIVAEARRRVDRMEEVAGRRLDCRLGPAGDCPVSVRYIAEVHRTAPPAEVLAQVMVAFAVAEADPRVVAVNLVAPEDDAGVLARYREQMAMVGRIAARHPAVRVTLHAGELTLGQVPPGDLSGHVRQAIELARAERIGHGVDIAYEEEPERLLRAMARDGVAVEINLTSNAMLLGVSGREHPFPTYRRYGVPVVLSTDDEGILRTDLTREYVRAVETYDLDYADVKRLARRSLEVSFLPGRSLWRDIEAGERVAVCGEPSSTACQDFLNDNARARRQWDLERRFRAFEADRAALLRQGVMPPLSAYRTGSEAH